MRNRTLLVMLAVLVALSGATALILYLSGQKDAEVSMGSLLFEKLDVNKATLIKVASADGSFTVTRKANGWQVDKGFDYPADFDKVSRFLRGLTELKVGRSFDATPERIARLTLASPADSASKKDSRGALFIVLDDKGGEIVRLLVGRERSGKDQFEGMPQGQFVLTGDGKKIYLVDRFFEMEEQKPADWMDKALVSVEATEIKSITCRAAGQGISPVAVYELARAEKGKEITAVVFPAGKKTSRGSIERMTQFLGSLTCDDADRPDPGIFATSIIDFVSFAGVTYRVSVLGATTEDGCPVRIQVLYSGADKKVAAEAKKDNDRLSPWVFRVGKWRCDYLARDAEALEEKPVAEPQGPPSGMEMGQMPPGFDPSMFGAP